MKIRPHHVLCLGFFQGEGYSDAFCCNMAQIKQRLRADTQVEVTKGLDDVCAACPQKMTGCDGAAKYDDRVLELCGMRYGQVQCWDECTKTAQQKILAKDKLSAVCGDCQWAQLCQGIAQHNERT